MSRIRPDQELVPSLLDRLIDYEPESSTELPKSRSQLLREMKNSVRRDLENLLNTRWRCVAWPPDMNELETSLVNYGIPDFSGANMGAHSDRENLRRVIEDVIRRFEPRFKTVRVEILKNKDDADRMVRFRIDALLYAEPAPEPVVFSSALEPADGKLEVQAELR